MYGPILELQLDCSHYKCEINTWDPWNCVASIASVQTTFLFSEGKTLSLGQTVHSSSSTVRWGATWNTFDPLIAGRERLISCRYLLRDKRCTTKLKSGPTRRRVYENWMPFLKVQQQYVPIHSNGHCFSVQNTLQTLSQDLREKYQIIIIKRYTEWTKLVFMPLNQVKTAGHHFLQSLPCWKNTAFAG